MKNQVASMLNRAQIDALLAARYDDVFSVLGMHEHPSGQGLIARALLPGASAVDVIANNDNRTVASLTLIDEAGLFEGSLGRRRKRFSYRLRIQFGDDLVEREDPYRFPSLLKEDELYLFSEGTQEQVYQWMGAHAREIEGVDGMLFVLWAPDAGRVSVVGEFNAWDGRCHSMRKHPASGVWEIFVPGIGEGLSYKYEIATAGGEVLPLKADPYAFAMQHPPDTASKTVSAQPYAWQEDEWMSTRASSSNHYQAPISIYEVHLGSWRRSADKNTPRYSKRLGPPPSAVRLRHARAT